MRAVGANHGATNFGKILRDGGLAVADDSGVVLAISEERLSRKKHDPGQRLALAKAIENGVIAPAELSSIFWSGCCELLRPGGRAVSHHLSHAVLGHCWSGNERSLVFVIDDGGDCLTPLNDSNEWWGSEREQLSVFAVSRTDIRLLERDFIAPGRAGLGEIYRAFTYHLGWHSGRHAGKTMALAAFGEAKRYANLLFDLTDGALSSPVNDLNPYQPEKAVGQCLRHIGAPAVSARPPGTPLAEEHVFAAAVVQEGLEAALVRKIDAAVRKYKIRDVVLSGGVALNCRAAQSVAEKTAARSVFVPPASSDQGQALGNALVGLWFRGKKKLPDLHSPFLGFEYDEALASVRRSLDAIDMRAAEAIEYSEHALFRRVASILFSGQIVFWFQGRSEYGARALGNRSILAAPFKAQTATQLNSLKGRDTFMPFAASTTVEAAAELFIDSVRSPFMTRTFSVRPSMRKEFGAIVHVDGTCRAQIISKDDAPKFHRLLSSFGLLSGVPMLLNTSLNGAGEPIVETPTDALRMFQMQQEVRYCVIGNVLVEKVRVDEKGLRYGNV